MRDVLNIPERVSQAFIGYCKLAVKLSMSWRKGEEGRREASLSPTFCGGDENIWECEMTRE